MLGVGLLLVLAVLCMGVTLLHMVWTSDLGLERWPMSGALVLVMPAAVWMVVFLVGRW